MTLEVFFDYACPYCLRGHQNLLALLPRHPGLEILWRPCEAHPRPEPARVHSDLAIQGMYLVQEAKGDLWQYHAMVYAALFEQGQDISDPGVLREIAAACGCEPGAFSNGLAAGRFSAEVEAGNRLAWEECRLDAVPSYRAGGKILGSRDGIMVPRRELARFLEQLEEKRRT